MSTTAIDLVAGLGARPALDAARPACRPERPSAASPFGAVLAAETAGSHVQDSDRPARAGRPDAPGASDPQPDHGRDGEHAIGRTRHQQVRDEIAEGDSRPTPVSGPEDAEPAAPAGGSTPITAADDVPADAAPADAVPADGETEVAASDAVPQPAPTGVADPGAAAALAAALVPAVIQVGAPATAAHGDGTASAEVAQQDRAAPIPVVRTIRALTEIPTAPGDGGQASGSASVAPGDPATVVGPAAPTGRTATAEPAAIGSAGSAAGTRQAATEGTATVSAAPASAGAPAATGAGAFAGASAPTADGEPAASAGPAAPPSPSGAATAPAAGAPGPAAGVPVGTGATAEAAAQSANAPRGSAGGPASGRQAPGVKPSLRAGDRAGTDAPPAGGVEAADDASAAPGAAVRPALAATPVGERARSRVHAMAEAVRSATPTHTPTAPSLDAATPADVTTASAETVAVASPATSLDATVAAALTRIRTTLEAGVPGLESSIQDPVFGTIRVLVAARPGETIRAELVAANAAIAGELAGALDRALAAGATLPAGVEVRVRADSAVRPAAADQGLNSSLGDGRGSAPQPDAGDRRRDDAPSWSFGRESDARPDGGTRNGRTHRPDPIDPAFPVSRRGARPGSALDVRA